MDLAKGMLVAALAAGTAGSAFALSLGGSGTPDDPYTIGSYEDLREFALVINGTDAWIEQNLYAWAVVTNDIAAEGEDWRTIGEFYSYHGTFDGLGHTISGLKNEWTSDRMGLFGIVATNGVVRNVRLKGVEFHGEYAGGIAGYNGGTVSNCCVSGSVRGERYAGGIVGFNFGIGTIANCYNTGEVWSGDLAGGIAGCNSGWIRNCHGRGSVSVSGETRGGIVGGNISGTVVNSYCPDILGVEAIWSSAPGRVEGECKTLSADAYTKESSFSGWDFGNVWGMGPEGPELQVIWLQLWVGGTRVRLANAKDILGDGSACFRGGLAGGTLAMTNAAVTGTYDFGGSTANVYAGEELSLTVSPAYSNRVANAEPGGYGIYAEKNLALAGAGNLVAEAETDGIHVAGGTLSFGGTGRVEAVATAADGVAVRGEGGIDLPPWLVVIEPRLGGVSGDRKTIVDRDGNRTARAVVEPLVAYPLWVGGVQVFNTNAVDVLEDGTVRFAGTATNGTLTLSNATVTGTSRYDSSSANIFAESGFDLTISLDGTNRVANTQDDGCAVWSRDNLRLAGEGVLDAEGDRCGIYVPEGCLAIDGTTVFAKGGDGLTSFSGLTISNATVTATGSSSFAINAVGASNFLAIVDSTVTATGGTRCVVCGELSVTGASRLDATGGSEEAVHADRGIAIGAGLAVLVPLWGERSGDGTTIVDANGDLATRVEIGPGLFAVTVVDGSPANATVLAGEFVAIAAKDPEDGKAFVEWSPDDEADVAFSNRIAHATAMRMPPRDVTVTAKFAAIRIDPIPAQEWTGSAVTPDVHVKLDGVELTLEPGTDYTVSYTNNVAPGTATATVAMAPPRTGRASTTFTIVPPEPPVVSNVVARQRWPWNGLVDVDYEISGYTAGLKAEIVFEEQGGTNRWTATKFFADVEPTLNPGLNRATWDSKAEGATDLVATVVATMRLVREE